MTRVESLHEPIVDFHKLGEGKGFFYLAVEVVAHEKLFLLKIYRIEALVENLRAGKGFVKRLRCLAQIALAFLDLGWPG